MNNSKEDLAKVRALVFDVDGVLSSSMLYVYPGGELMRSMNIKDGYAIQYAVRKGYSVAIISGGNSGAIKKRFRRLGVRDIYLKSHNKKKDLEDFLSRRKLSHEQVLYMGDDLPDYEVMNAVGYPACPADAVEEIKVISKYISDKHGGDGCVRDVIEQVLRLQEKWMDGDAYHW